MLWQVFQSADFPADIAGKAEPGHHDQSPPVDDNDAALTEGYEWAQDHGQAGPDQRKSDQHQVEETASNDEQQPVRLVSNEIRLAEHEGKTPERFQIS